MLMNDRNITDWYYNLITKGFRFYPSFSSELFKLLQKNGRGHEKEIFNLLNKQFDAVLILKDNINHFDGNEILKHICLPKPIYSIHIKNKTVNFRIIIAFNSEGDPCLLCVFNEKSDSKETYDKYKVLIKERFNEFVELG